MTQWKLAFNSIPYAIVHPPTSLKSYYERIYGHGAGSFVNKIDEDLPPFINPDGTRWGKEFNRFRKDETNEHSRDGHTFARFG